jgi:AbrB family looped-hinge helix DNA binding protein
VIEMGIIVGTSKVSAGGRTTIPDEVRELLKISEGDLIVYEYTDGEVYIKAAKPPEKEEVKSHAKGRK